MGVNPLGVPAEPAPGQDGWPPHPAELTVPNRKDRRTYQRKRARLTLAFDRHATLDGLEIVCRQVSLGKVMDLQLRFAAYQRAETGSDEERAALEAMLQEFGEMVEGWNYQDEGTDVPFTWQMLLNEFDYAETMAIINAHLAAVQGVAGPLPQTSGAGQPSAEASIPMDVSSPSLAS